MFMARAKISLKPLREDDQESDRKPDDRQWVAFYGICTDDQIKYCEQVDA